MAAGIAVFVHTRTLRRRTNVRCVMSEKELPQGEIFKMLNQVYKRIREAKQVEYKSVNF